MGREGGLYHIFSANLIQVTRLLCGQTLFQWQYASATQFTLKGYACLTGKADVKTVS